MIEHALVHVANVAGDESIKLVLDAAFKPVGEVITSGVRRYFRLHGDDIEEIRLEVERLRETIETLGVEVRSCGGSSADAMNAEAQQPAFKSFAERAFRISTNTTLESKRRLAGALIARRLCAKTDSAEEILLRRTLKTMEDLTENQMLMLAAAHLVIYGPALDSHYHTFESRDALEMHLHARYFPLVRMLYDTLHFDKSDYDTLASVGAVRLHDDTGALMVEAQAAPPLDMWMLQHGVHQYDGLEGAWGSQESKDAYHSRFPTIILLKRLAGGTSRSTPENQRRLDEVLLTPLGATIGDLILHHLGSSASLDAPTIKAP